MIDETKLPEGRRENNSTFETDLTDANARIEEIDKTHIELTEGDLGVW